MPSDEWRDLVQVAWADLAQAEPVDGGLQTMHLPAGPPGAMRLHHSDEGHRHLFVRSDEPTQDPIPGGAALSCSSVALTFDGVTEQLLDIACTDQTLFEVFDDLIVSIIAETSRTGDAATAARTTLVRWRDLMRARTERLSHQREMGLFGELKVLEVVHGDSGPIDPAVWLGPTREAKDIIFDAHSWVEVKAIGPGSEVLTINGLDQLEDLEGHEGALAVLVVVEAPDDGETIADLVDRLKIRMDDNAANRFEDLLLTAGWARPPDERSWIVEEWIVVPAGSCPRLGPAVILGGVPAGLSRLRYDIEVPLLRSRSSRTPVADLRALGAQP